MLIQVQPNDRTLTDPHEVVNIIGKMKRWYVSKAILLRIVGIFYTGPLFKVRFQASILV